MHNPSGVSNLWNMPKLDQLKCDFSSLSLAAPFSFIPSPLPPFLQLTYSFSLSCTTQFSTANVFIKWQSSGFNYYDLSGGIKTHKKRKKEPNRVREREKERERRRRERVRTGEESNWAALLKCPQVPSSSNTNNKLRQEGRRRVQGRGKWVGV